MAELIHIAFDPKKKYFEPTEIIQRLLRFYHSDLHSNAIKPKVLLMASTS